MKQRKSFYTAWLQRAFMLMTAVTAFSFSASAQANYWSIFGASSAGCGGSSPLSFAMNATATSPTSSSFTGITTLDDLSDLPGSPLPAAHTTYNSTGQPLFSVDQNAIYSPNGNEFYDFGSAGTNNYTSYESTLGFYNSNMEIGTTFIVPGGACSEVCTFPCVNNPANTNYWVVFWSQSSTVAFGLNPYTFLRAIQLDIDPSGNLSVTLDTDLTDLTISPSAPGFTFTSPTLPFSFAIATDAAPCGGARDLYTIDPSEDGAGNFYGNLRKWTFPADGSFPSSSVPTFLGTQEGYPAFAPNAKIFTIAGAKYMAYATGSTLTTAWASILALWNVASPSTFNTYNFGSQNNINGFEHVTYGDDYLYASVSNYSGASYNASNYSASSSGIEYYDVTGASGPSLIGSTDGYSNTDIELGQSGNLFMVYNPTSPSTGILPPTGGYLAYIPHTSLGTSTAPTLIASSCSTASAPAYISVFNSITSYVNSASIAPAFYLTKQYPGEGNGYPQITNVDLNTRCAPGYSTASPAVLPQYTVTATGGATPYTYLWTPIPLVTTTGGYTPPDDVILDHYTSATPTIIGLSYYTSHGISSPDLVSSFILTVADANGCTATQDVYTQLITSGFDLASRDSYDDLYCEANNQALITGNWQIWQSPDIWNRYHNDGLDSQTNESPAYVGGSEDTNYLYTKIRNVGCDNFSGDKDVYHYWVCGGTAETWPGAWTVDSLTNCDSVRHPEGHVIDSLGLGPIPAGTYVITQTPWTSVPNPDNYFPLSCYSVQPVMDICFLSRIVDNHGLGLATSCGPEYMTYCEEPGDPSPNVRNNNNIVTLNTTVITLSSLATHRHVAIIGNAGATAAVFSLQFVNGHQLKKGSGISTLSNYVKIKVYLGPVFSIWQAAGSHGKYAAMDINEQSVTFDGSNEMRLDSITFDSGAQYPISIEFDMLPGVDGNQIPNETVSFRQLSFSAAPTLLIDSAIVGTIDTIFSNNPNLNTYDTVYSMAYDTLYNKTDTVYGNYTYHIRYSSDTGTGRRTANNQQTTTKTASLLNLLVFPVPASSTLTFQYTQQPNITIKLFDITGRLITTQTLQNSTSATFSVATYTPGMYLYQVSTNKTTQSGKVLIGN